MKIEGHISRKTVRLWLENYQAMIADDRIPDVMVGCTRKADDGIGGTFLNRVILQKALADMEHKAPRLYWSAFHRWIVRNSLTQALKANLCSKSVYYRRCDKAVDYIYYHVNGKLGPLMDLVEAIKKGA